VRTRSHLHGLKIPVESWADLASIPDRVIDAVEVYGLLAMNTTDEHYRHHSFLTRLFFHSWGPYTFKQVGGICAVLRETTRNNIPVSNPGPAELMRALDDVEEGSVIKRRWYIVRLLNEREARE
jgi:hypothetical protein